MATSSRGLGYPQVDKFEIGPQILCRHEKKP